MRLDGELDLEEFSGLDTDTGVAIASVHPTRLADVERGICRLGLQPCVVGRDFEVPIVNRYRDATEVGVDRLLGVLAASRLHPGEGVVVVDLGTALTVNVGSPEGEFLGGFIGVGMTMAARALCQHAPRLPDVGVAVPGDPARRRIPRDTHTAITEGIFLEVAGGVERMLAELEVTLPWPFHVLATGGDVSRLAAAIPAIGSVEAGLVPMGLVESFRIFEGRQR